MKKIIIILFLALILAGCSSNNNYEFKRAEEQGVTGFKVITSDGELIGNTYKVKGGCIYVYHTYPDSLNKSRDLKGSYCGNFKIENI